MRQQMKVVCNRSEKIGRIYVTLKHVALLSALIVAILLSGCITPETQEEQPGGNLSVSELLEAPEYDTEVSVYGRVSLLGELLCPCFELTSNGETMQVWYDLMVDDDGTERPAVRVEGIENGDWVVVTGELKTAGTYRAQNDFWASRIEKQDFYEEITEAESKAIARAFIENSPTYQFDGFDLEYNRTYAARCPYCWTFIFVFQSRHAGYGDRTGQMLAQVITPHTASVNLEQGVVTYAILDGTWDMLTQTTIPGGPIGGETDEHGCLGVAGYVWCESRHECIRPWEEDCPAADTPQPEYDQPPEGQAQEIAKEYVLNMSQYIDGNGRNLTVTDVAQTRCPGCWTIDLQFYLDSKKDPGGTDKATVKITLVAWEVVDVVYAQGTVTFLTPEECEALDWQVVDINNKCSCNANN